MQTTVIARVVATEGFPLTDEFFEGNKVDSTTLKEIIQSKDGKAPACVVFDRGITTEDNLALLRKCGACRHPGTELLSTGKRSSNTPPPGGRR